MSSIPSTFNITFYADDTANADGRSILCVALANAFLGMHDGASIVLIDYDPHVAHKHMLIDDPSYATHF